MEKKLVRVPFDLELAKKITSCEVSGRVVTRDGDSVRILCWNKKGKAYPIAAFVDNGYEEDFKTYTNEGIWNIDKTCTVKKYDLFLEIPEYMTYKDGDVCVLGWERENENRHCKWICVIKSVKSYTGNDLNADEYVSLCLDAGEEDRFGLEFDIPSNAAKWCRKATEEEKQILINKLKASKEPKAKEYLKRFFGIEQKYKYEFKPKDWVLSRDDGGEWYLEIFSHKRKDGEFACVGNIWKECIPYNDQTAHLIGTTDNWEE